MRVPLSSILLSAAVVGLVACSSQGNVPSHSPMQMPDSLVGPGLVAGSVVATPVPGASPTPTPTPNPNPTPTPTPTPTPNPNGNPVARLTAKVLGVVCNNEGVPNSENMTRVPVGCKVRLDLNAKDADNDPTDPKGEPAWEYHPEGLVDVRPDSFTPLLIVREEGTLHVSASVDGVTSNDLVLTFYR